MTARTRVGPRGEASGRGRGNCATPPSSRPPDKKFHSLVRISGSKILVSPAALVAFLPCAIDYAPNHTAPRSAQLKAALGQAQSAKNPTRAIASVESGAGAAGGVTTGVRDEAGRRVACSRTGWRFKLSQAALDSLLRLYQPERQPESIPGAVAGTVVPRCDGAESSRRSGSGAARGGGWRNGSLGSAYKPQLEINRPAPSWPPGPEGAAVRPAASD
jgi:hypothetical protein